MLKKCQSRIMREEELAKYKHGNCIGCPSYPCELIPKCNQYAMSHSLQSSNSIPVKAYTVKQDAEIRNKCMQVVVEGANIPLMSYDHREFQGKKCTIRRGSSLYECGNVKVSEGIGDDYKFKLEFHNGKWQVERNSEGKWEPEQSILISAQTGKGKNYMVENKLIPYINDLNDPENSICKPKTNLKILIISNRLALKCQIKNRLNQFEDEDNLDKEIFPYARDTYVTTYQSVLNNQKRLEGWQESEDGQVLYVICDEAHFFTSDALFNPDTEKILETIVRIFHGAVRIYMTATPYESMEYISRAEDRIFQFKCSDVFQYHFTRDYEYFNVFGYAVEEALFPKILESVEKPESSGLPEKWLIFLDDKNMGESIKELLERYLSEHGVSKKWKVRTVSAESKSDPKYVSMVKNETLDDSTFVLISTSVLDNGVNFWGIKNIAVSSLSMVKCIQMAGRARVDLNDPADRKNLYLKKFTVNDVTLQINTLKRYKDEYRDYEDFKAGNNKNFVREYMFDNSIRHKDLSHLFNISDPNDIGTLYPNEIARSMVDRLIPQYEAILEEMLREPEPNAGTNYLAYEFSWFGKEYSADRFIDYVPEDLAPMLLGKSYERDDFLEFIGNYADKGTLISKGDEQDKFRESFTRKYDRAFVNRLDKNPERNYGYKLINKGFAINNLDFRLEKRGTTHPDWIIVHYDRQSAAPDTLNEDDELDESDQD